MAWAVDVQQDHEAAERRPSIEKKPMVMPDVDDNRGPSAFERLPDEIIEQILLVTDPNSFASLVLLNSKWRTVSQQAHLYAHHLMGCPSYAVCHKGSLAAADSGSLPKLRRLFAQEVKRNLFEAYLRPSRTAVKLISNSISSSSCPGGEGMQFSPSPLGRHLLAYNSSRIYVIDVTAPEIAVKRELKILRRPAATCIKDDGSLLAVLLTEMQVDLYDLTASPPRRTQSIILDHSPRAIALSPCGTVLAAAYEGGIEVSSLNPSGLATDRRAVKCDAVDALAFSLDGTQILGTTIHSSTPSTVILTAPYYDPGSHISDDNISALWTTSILFPNTSRDCSHAVLIQDGRHEEASWAFTYDRSFETFRAVRIDDLRNGTTYFTGPVPSPTSQAKLIPCTLPAASYHGELVSAGFQGKEIWLYGVPEDLDAIADPNNGVAESMASSHGLNRRNSGPSIRSPSRVQETNEASRVPQWQVLCDKLRNTFVNGNKIAELDGVNMVKWVAGFAGSSLKERLVVAARGVLPPKPATEEDTIDFVDGGRVTLIDFNYGTVDGEVVEITVEVGTKEPEVLEEEHRDMDTEVAIVRRRTVAQKRGTRGTAMRAPAPATSSSRPPPPSQPPPSEEADADDPLVPRRIGAAPRRAEPTVITEDTETESILEEQEALDAPYAHASPRSGTTLRRAATAAAANRRLHPQAAAAGHIEYRRADGRAEHPHESDADNWVPPPPPYQKDDPQDLPAFMRHAIPAVTVSAAPTPSASQPARSQTSVPVRRDAPPPRSSTQVPSHRRLASGSSASGSQGNSSARSLSRQSNYVDGDNVYDVSPPESPNRTSRHAPRNVSGSGSLNSTNSGQNIPSPRPATAAPAQRPAPAGSHILTVTGPHSSRSPPALELQIPSPTIGNVTWADGRPGTSPAIKRISNSQTWPTPPKPSGATAVLPAGYPYSAPPTNLTASESLSQSYPPAPRPEQLASLSNHDHAPPPRRLSGGFQVQRVPVGSRSSQDGPRWSRQNAPAPQQPPLQIQQPQARRPSEIVPVPPPDTPLIISTPKGISGAFDPPSRSTSDRRSGPPILAPVPRHPRPNAQPAVLRPTMDRLETIYSVSSNQGQPPAASNSSNFLAPPASLGSSNGRHLKQSRAERSAAKNIADAKRRGWTGRRRSKRRKKQERDFDAASSAAWTDVSFSSAGFTNITARSGRNMQPSAKERRCIVM